MKTTLALLALSAIFSTSAFAKIVMKKNQYFIETKRHATPLSLVNELVKKDQITRVKVYGNAHLISYATKEGPVKLYSVDEKGFTYAIEPFSTYSVSNIEKNGKFQFNEVPGRKYVVDAKGFFIH